jgi:hypothetical protein
MIGMCISLLGLILLFVVLWDAFETIVLPRRVQRRVRLTRIFYSVTWQFWTAIARRMRSSPRRDAFLSYYGPLSLPMLLSIWALSLMISFTLLYWGLATVLVGPEGPVGFGGALYMSGSTLFTLGMGDITPSTTLGRLVTVTEAGTGIAFLALVIGYLPVIYQAFSRREASISLLDARAGSPPSAAELLRRQVEDENAEGLAQFLRDWERWAAELLESHLSYPVLAYYRSQHDRESWLAALTMVLDVCTLILVGIDGAPTRAAHLTFAMARHAAVDLSQIFGTPPHMPAIDRLPSSDLARRRAVLAAAGMQLQEGPEADQHLAAIRAKYEPYVHALADYLFVALPPWMGPSDSADDWQTSIWEHAPTGDTSKKSLTPHRLKKP